MVSENNPKVLFFGELTFRKYKCVLLPMIENLIYKKN